MNVMVSLSSLLDEFEDPNVELVVLEAIQSVLEKGHDAGRIAVEESGCMKAIDELCYHDNDDVRVAASHIMDTWFSSDMNEEENDDAKVAPATSANTFTFQAPATGSTVFDFSVQHNK
jgi:importin subunit alpha-1